MKAILLPAVAALLLAAVAGCRPAQAKADIFEAWEAGRTLIFEDPELPDAPPARIRFQQRLQKQVLRSTEEEGGRRIQTAYTTFQGRQELTFLVKDGRVSLLDGSGRPLLLLPAGFPDRAATWERAGYRLRVLGWALWDRSSPAFPPDRPAEGVWVEGEPLQGGARMRIFYLPDFGEVERREWRDGRWTTTSLLVGWSFQEVPRGAG